MLQEKEIENLVNQINELIPVLELLDKNIRSAEKTFEYANRVHLKNKRNLTAEEVSQLYINAMKDNLADMHVILNKIKIIPCSSIKAKQRQIEL